MGTNYYWLFNKDYSKEDINSFPELPKSLYRKAFIQQQAIDQEYEKDNFIRDNEYEVEGFCYYRGKPTIAGLHIGKNSYGWVFGLHIHPRHNIKTYEDWKTLLPYGKVINEYLDEVKPKELIHTIENISVHALTLPKRPKPGYPESSHQFLDEKINLYRRNLHTDFVVDNTHQYCDYLTCSFS
jgi:hypothetical protein